jgi:hypothetical protein
VGVTADVSLWPTIQLEKNIAFPRLVRAIHLVRNGGVLANVPCRIGCAVAGDGMRQCVTGDYNR